jgi:hypothetical protein
VLSWFVPPELAEEVIAQARAEADAAAAAGGGEPGSRRVRVLPARLGLYFVLGLCLFPHLPYCQVIRVMSGGVRGILEAAGWGPSSPALTGLRRRLGDRPLELLLERTASALSPGREALIGGLLAVAWDGTTVKVPASPANAAWFGRPGQAGKAGNAEAAYPQARLVALVACGTRALLGARLGPARGKGTGEQALARGLPGLLRAGMLLLADRGFYSYGLWTAAAARADLLWRVKDSMHLPVVRELPDGSFLTHVSDPRAVAARIAKNGGRRRRGGRLPPDAGPVAGITVRVIEYALTVTDDQDGSTRTGRYRMITTLLDWQACPAAELAAGYARRWAIETAYRELKTHLRGPRILRSRDPVLARQEIWAYLVTYQAIRAVIAYAAAGTGTDPARLSFTAALHAVRRTAAAPRTTTALARTAAEILAAPSPTAPAESAPAPSTSAPSTTRPAQSRKTPSHATSPTPSPSPPAPPDQSQPAPTPPPPPPQHAPRNRLNLPALP